MLEQEVKTNNDCIDNLEKEVTAKEDSIQKLVREVSFLKDPPYTFFCAADYYGTAGIGTIRYSTLLYSSTNIPDAIMNLRQGRFTSGWGGTYTVTWSLVVDDTAGEQKVTIYLRKNGEDISDSSHQSQYTGPSGGVLVQGGRTLLLRLERGDTVELWCENCGAGVGH